MNIDCIADTIPASTLDSAVSLLLPRLCVEIEDSEFTDGNRDYGALPHPLRTLRAHLRGVKKVEVCLTCFLPKRVYML